MYRSKKREQAAKDLILKQAEKLQELNDYKDKIFSVISHDIRGPIISLDSSLTLLDEKILSIGQFEEIKKILQQQLGSVTLLLDNLLKWSMANMTGGKTNKSEVLNVRAIADETIGIMQVFADEKKIKISNTIPDELTAIGDAGNVDIIIRNLISNAIKFSRNEGNISVAAQRSGNKTQITVTDTGIGMTPAQVKKLFTISTDNSTYGTMGEKGIGLGLLMSYEFAKANKGDITVNSELGKGSTFILSLPYL
jgi:signal transduction histidine kinase